MTWDEVLKLPLETKIRLPWWDKERYACRKRDEDGMIEWFDELDDSSTPEILDFGEGYLYQDRYEIYQEPKPERQYMDGFEALKLVYQGKKVALDDEKWLARQYLAISRNGTLVCGAGWGDPVFAVLKEYMLQKKWYVMED